MGQAVNLYMTQQGVRLVIPATQGENLAREYDITVIGLDGQPVDLTGTTVSMYVIKRGGETVQIAATVSGNVATVVLPSGACDTPGDNMCFIQVIKPDVYDLRVDNVILRVIPCNIDGAGEASEEFGTLTQLIADAQTAISNANTAAGNANAAAEEAASTAETTATSVATTVATSTAASVINEQKGQPNGLATLDSTGKLTTGQFPDPNDVGVYNLEAGEAIPSGADLNDYVTPGVYSASYAVMSSLLNLPEGLPTASGMRLVVNNIATTDNIAQTIYSNDFLNGNALIFYRVIFTDSQTFRPWAQLQTVDDTGWQTAALTSDFKLYASGSPVRYRRKNGVVTVSGVVSPSSDTNEIGSSTRVDMFTLPEGYRPVSDVVILCQGTSTDLWVFGITTSGAAFASRYRDETGYVTPADTAWMPFTATFLTA